MNDGGFQGKSILAIILFSVIIVAVTVGMTLKNTSDMMEFLEESIKSELISTSIAARGILDLEKFDSYNSFEDIINDYSAYWKVLSELRHLKLQIGDAYIYALKEIDGAYYLIFDTDLESSVYFDEYEISEVHQRAFLGYESAGVMNVSNVYGEFNSGGVPIRKGGKIIGIICTDIEDTFVQESRDAAARNAIALVLTLIATLGIMAAIVSILLKNVRKMQDKLFKMANYDALTGLPNRHYLMTYLPEVAKEALKKQDPFAFLLIDLDNFKQVNDNSGHDAGDELLRHIATYLNSVHDHSLSFRPPAGALNVSARIGGDEFVQIVPGIRTADEAEMVAKKVLSDFSSQTIDRYVEKYQVGLSIGVALFPFHTENYNVLIKYADMAMYHAKNMGKNTYSIYDDGMNQADSGKQQEKEGKPTHERRQNRS